MGMREMENSGKDRGCCREIFRSTVIGSSHLTCKREIHMKWGDSE